MNHIVFAPSNRRWIRMLGGLLLVALTTGTLTGCTGGKRELQRTLLEQGFELPDQGPRFADQEALKRFDQEAAIDEERYLLGVGDRVQVNVWNDNAITGDYIVGPDGEVRLPLAGAVDVDERPLDEVEAEIAEALATYYRYPSVSVNVKDYRANRIYVLGRVEFQGVIHYDTPMRLLEALARVGALPTSGVSSDKATLTRCAIVRGKDRMLWIDLKNLVKGQDLGLNIRLRRNDLLYLPDAADELVYVLGEVERPGAYNLSPEMTVLDALAQAGSVTEDGKANTILFIRPSAGIQVELTIEQFLTDPEVNVSLEDGDILYVPRRGIAKAGYVLRQLSPATGLLLLGPAYSR